MPEFKVRGSFSNQIPQVVLDPSEIRANLAEADPALLLLSLVHVTGDVSLLERYADKIASESSGEWRIVPKKVVSSDVLDELIDQLCTALARSEQPAYLGVDDLGVFAKMAEVAVGGHIEVGELQMFLEQAGFQADQPTIPQTKAPSETLNVAIIGAGMAGITAAIGATDRGYSYEIFERSEHLGGVWWENTYPGVAVDTPTLYYSLSFEMSPDWTDYYPTGDQYLKYLERVADKYSITEHLHLSSEVTKLEWDDNDQVWEITYRSADGTTKSARAAAIITALGHFNRPSFPDLPGRETFAGDSFHSAQWNHDVDLEGKRVGIIGSGASGVQIISTIADQVGHLTSFQRQPHWIMPNKIGDGRVAENERWRLKHLPYYMQWRRFAAFWFSSRRYDAIRVDPAWAKDHLSISKTNDTIMHDALDYIDRCFGAGSELAKKLTPDFPPFGKRLIRDPGEFREGGYYFALSQPNVDVNTSKLARIVPEGIETVDGELIELDVIIYATGFALEWLASIEIIGRDGQVLKETWTPNPKSYIGGTVPGFPNLFVNSGPNSGLGYAGGQNFIAEASTHYALECLQLVLERDGRSIEPKQEAHDRHNEKLEAVMEGSIWKYALDAVTYYRNDVGHVVLPNPWTLNEYWQLTREPIEADFIIR